MSKRNSESKSAKGEFEEFKSGWLLQVAADRGAKAAAPAAMVLACQYLNRGSGKAWPGINSLKEKTGAASGNTIRSALKLLEKRGHAIIEWSDGGKNKTHVVTPLVNGIPFKKLKGMEKENPSTFDPETLQVSDAKPFKKLNPNHLKEPLDLQGAAQAAPPEGEYNNSNSREPVSAYADRLLISEEEVHDYTLEDLDEIERRDRAFIESQLPEFDGEEAPPPTSLDDFLDSVVAGQNSQHDTEPQPSAGADADQEDAQFVSKDDPRLKILLVACRKHRRLFDQAEYSGLLAIEDAILAEGGLDADQMVDLQELAGLVAKRTDKLANAGADDAGWPEQNTTPKKEARQ